MIRNFDSKKELILDATLQLMASKNSTKVTIREIAKLANINVASINYYFNSKEELLKEVDNHFMSNFLDLLEPMYQDDKSSDEKLEEWLKKAISYGFHYPGMLTLIQDKINNISDEADMEFKLKFLCMLGEFRNLLIEVCNPNEEEENALFMSIAGCFMLPLLTKSSVFNIVDISFSEEQLMNEIKLVIHKFKNK